MSRQGAQRAGHDVRAVIVTTLGMIDLIFPAAVRAAFEQTKLAEQTRDRAG
jgi:hypothetical protein